MVEAGAPKYNYMGFQADRIYRRYFYMTKGLLQPPKVVLGGN